MERCFRKCLYLSIFGLMFFAPAGFLWAQTTGVGLMYSSYLPFTSIYNNLQTKNEVTGLETSTIGFEFGKGDIMHYAPGVAITSAFAYQGLLTSIDLGVMGGAGADNIIPAFPVRPFISLNAGYKFTPTGIPLGIYGIAGIYVDFAIGVGKLGYEFIHFLGYFRLGPGISLKLGKMEIFAQAQFAIGLQMEDISLRSKAGNPIYEGVFMMVPIALFPEAGVRFWF
ncbi:MAG: hypothetical protein AAF975_04765 [Spirochaetota bacterium]